MSRDAGRPTVGNVAGAVAPLLGKRSAKAALLSCIRPLSSPPDLLGELRGARRRPIGNRGVELLLDKGGANECEVTGDVCR